MHFMPVAVLLGNLEFGTYQFGFELVEILGAHAHRPYHRACNAGVGCLRAPQQRLHDTIDRFVGHLLAHAMRNENGYAIGWRRCGRLGSVGFGRAPRDLRGSQDQIESGHASSCAALRYRIWRSRNLLSHAGPRATGIYSAAFSRVSAPR